MVAHVRRAFCIAVVPSGACVVRPQGCPPRLIRLKPLNARRADRLLMMSQNTGRTNLKHRHSVCAVQTNMRHARAEQEAQLTSDPVPKRRCGPSSSCWPSSDTAPSVPEECHAEPSKDGLNASELMRLIAAAVIAPGDDTDADIQRVLMDWEDGIELRCCCMCPKTTISSPVFDEPGDDLPTQPAVEFKCACPPLSCNFAGASTTAKAEINALDSATRDDLTALWASVSERGPAWLDGPPTAVSLRCNQLHDEMSHLGAKQRTERAQIYADCLTYDNYLRCVQLDLLSPAHRRKVFEWNIEMADILKLSNQALLLAFAYFDRYLALTPSRLKDLQLLSTACMWVASKVCSTECPVATSNQLASLYSDVDGEDIKRMEVKLFAVLKWRVHPTMPYDIVQLIVPCVSLDHPGLQLKLSQLTESILLSAALVYPMLKFDALVLAATAVACACELVADAPLGVLGFLDSLVAFVGADKQTTLECISMLRNHVRLDRLCAEGHA